MEYDTEADKIQAMIHGTFEFNDEDTEASKEVTKEEEVEADTTEQIDDDVQDTEDTTEAEVNEDEPEHTPVEDNSLGDVEVTDTDDKAVDSTDTEVKGADPEPDTSNIDYEKEYLALKEANTNLQGFYDKVTADFKADGVMHKGFTDPDKIIKSNQKAVNYEGRIAKTREFAPFMTPLKSRGMLDDPTKFDLAMNILDGDKEAIKQHLKNLNYDPITDLDLDTIEYSGKSQTTNPIELAYDDTMERAKSAGVSDKLNKDIVGNWDNQSTYDLLSKPEDNEAIISHMQSGVFDAVQTRIAEKARTDVYGNFTGKGNLDQYKEAFRELETEYQASRATETPQQETKQTNTTEDKVKDDNEAKERAEFEAYKAKVAANKVADEARKKASAVSKKKTPPKTDKKTVKTAENLTGDAFVDYWKKLEKVGL